MKISTSLTKTLARTLSIVLACSLLFVVGCTDTLGVDPRDELPEDAVWEDSSLIDAFLNEIYSGIGYGFGTPSLSSMVDEAKFTHGWGISPNETNTISPTDRGSFGPGAFESDFDTFERFRWDKVYGRIRDINRFLENVPGSSALSSDEKETLIGEARFLRAYFYHNLMRLHGGVPLVDGLFELGGGLESFQMPRNSFKETIDFIVNDLDAAAERLPIEGRDQGAATKGGALALKSRVLLHAASDLYNENPSDMEETGFTSGSQQERWEQAKGAAQAVIDLGVYSLENVHVLGDPMATADAYHELLIKGEPGGTGAIWTRFFDPSVGGFASDQHDISLWSSPNGYLSWSGDAPLQQHVDQYEMNDGSVFEWEGGDPVSTNEPIDVENPYKDRDPRFYANILFNGANWRERPSGPNNIDPKGVIQTGRYEMPGQEELRSGLDTRSGPFQDWNGSRTGYNMRKFIANDILPHNTKAHNPWPFLRYAEILLNFAEASVELGDTDDALWALNQIRARVGMPEVPPNGGPNRTLMERVRQERAVELAFEQHRYFDVRRWMTVEEAYQDAKGIDIVGRLDPDGELLVENRYNFLYNVRKIDNRGWNDKAYFLPIPQEEIDRNPNLVQNPGY